MRRLLTGCLVTLLLLVNTLILIGPLMVFATANIPLGGDARGEDQLVDLGPGFGDPHHRP
ncbi:hypothetical protein ALO76_200116 [Pseudomonas syringae pv. coriandricola]|nr:hypothetical protein ALO76_200116 [Pseudomonas syringae pv. coriandricola]